MNVKTSQQFQPNSCFRPALDFITIIIVELNAPLRDHQRSQESMSLYDAFASGLRKNLVKVELQDRIQGISNKPRRFGTYAES